MAGREHLVITVHGIRSYAEWQRRLAGHLRASKSGLQVASLNYGWFSVIAYALPPLRWMTLRRITKALASEIRAHPHARIDIVAHSFGSYLVAWSLVRLVRSGRLTAPIHTLVLAGSVLRPWFDWRPLLDGGNARRLVNECGTRDCVLVFGQATVIGSGLAGRYGFSGSDRLCINRYHDFGHSGYFSPVDKSDAWMRKWWVPLLTENQSEILASPLDGNTLSGWTQAILRSLELVKVGIVVASVWLATLPLRSQIQQLESEGISRELSVRSLQSALRGQWDLASLLAVEAVRAAETREAYDALLWAVGSSPVVPITLTNEPSEAAFFGPNASTVISLTAGQLVIWPAEGASPQDAFPSSTGVSYLSLDVTSDGRYAAAGRSDSTLVVFDLENGAQRASMRLPGAPHRVALSRDASIAAVLTDRSVFTWLVDDGTLVDSVAVEGLLSDPNLAISPTGRWVGFSSYLRNRWIRDVVAQRDTDLGVALPGPWRRDAFAFSPDSRFVAIAGCKASYYDPCEEGYSRVFELASGRSLGGLDGRSPEGFPSITFNTASAVAIAAGDSVLMFTLADSIQGEFSVVRSPPLTTQFARTRRWSGLRHVAFSPDARRLLASGFGGVTIWSLADTHPLATEIPSQSRTASATTTSSPDGRFDVKIERRQVVISRAESGKTLATYSRDFVRNLIAWDPDSRFLFVEASRSIRGGGGGLAVFRVDDWDSPPLTPGPERTLLAAIAASPDGRAVAVADGQRRIHIWDVQAQAWIGPPLPFQAAPVEALEFADMSTLLISHHTDGTSFRWDLSTRALRQVACDAVNRDLTSAEWRTFFGAQEHRATCEGGAR